MDHTNGLPYPPRGHPRAASRASNSTSSTRVTSNSHGSANTSQSAASPRLPHPSTLPHRPYTTTGTKPPLKDSPLDAHSPMSSFLQEKLQRERRVELDSRSVSSAKLPSDHRALDPRFSQSSPIRQEFARPPSSGGSESRRKGMGVKEMEQTVSTLHKQNFDLKLELYHRRERQTVLEDRLEGVLREKEQVEEMNDTLVGELEKRDKAVEEAVAMIVLLESRVETLLKEREMVRHVEEQNSAFHRLQYDEFDGGARAETPRPRAPSGGSTDASTRAMHRVPSFVSMRSSDTENLRSVYLGTHGSLHSLHRPEDKERASVASPSLSVLSESSFLSVYGKDVRNGDPADGRPSIDESLSEMRMAQPSRTAQREVRQQPRSNSMTTTRGLTRVPSVANMVDHTSPLQKLERTFSLKTNSSRQSGPETPDDAKAEPSPSHRRTKEQKREALKRVMTDAPGRMRDQGLPPTPDTISTTTLRRYKNSSDTLSRRPSGGMQHTEGARLDLPPLLQPPPKAASAAPKDAGTQLLPMTAFGARQDPASFFDNHVPITRPHSAGETTTSRHDEWDSDSDDDDARSTASSLDIWMREGWKPKKSGRDSPDLFGFPSSMGASWVGRPKRDDTSDLITRDGLLPSGVPPPPPNRRSSLHAPTGSTSEGVEATPRRKRHTRRNSDGIAVQDGGKGHYPPTAQQNRPRGLGRLNPFRRSIGGGETTPTVEANPAFSGAKSGMGMPSWIRSGDDDRPSATPPPILRNRGASVGVADDDGGVALDTQNVPPAPPKHTAPPAPAPAGGGGGNVEGRRKWLGGFGRRDSRRIG